LTTHAEPTHKMTVKILDTLRTIQGYTLAEYQMARAELIDDLQGDVELVNLARAAGNAAVVLPHAEPAVFAQTGVAPTVDTTVYAPPVANPWQTAPAAPAPAFTQAAQPAAPAGRNCDHGPMTYREGVGKNGPWRAYMCPTPKGTPGQCKAIFL